MLGDTNGRATELWLMAGLGEPMAIRVAASLRLADHIVAGFNQIADLAAEVGADAGALERLVNYLSARGVFSYDQEGRIVLTELSHPLLSDHPAGLREWFDIDTGGRGELAFVELMHSIRTGQAAFPVRYGLDFWEDLADDPARIETFNRRLGSDVVGRSGQIIEAIDWRVSSAVLDVGGGDGSLLLDLLDACPHLTGAVYDMKGACTSANRNFSSSSVGDRARTIEGSFFDPIPAGFDVYLLSLVLHDWQDRECVEILRRCREAAGTTGRVIVAETVEAGDRVHTGMDLRMLVIYGARERTADELAALGRAAGLHTTAVESAGTSTVVELVPAATLRHSA